MMNIAQAIERPFGISVSGSSIVKLEPDMACLRFAVERLAQHPKDVFQEVREASQRVRVFLAQARVDEVSFSRVTLSQSFGHPGGERRFIGYTARVSIKLFITTWSRWKRSCLMPSTPV